MSSATGSEMTCREIVELVNDYIEDALGPADRARFERHLGYCPHCAVYLDQIRVTIAGVRRLAESDVDPHTREDLVRAFRAWRGEASDASARDGDL